MMWISSYRNMVTVQDLPTCAGLVKGKHHLVGDKYRYNFLFIAIIEYIIAFCAVMIDGGQPYTMDEKLLEGKKSGSHRHFKLMGCQMGCAGLNGLFNLLVNKHAIREFLLPGLTEDKIRARWSLIWHYIMNRKPHYEKLISFLISRDGARVPGRTRDAISDVSKYILAKDSEGLGSHLTKELEVLRSGGHLIATRDDKWIQGTSSYMLVPMLKHRPRLIRARINMFHLCLCLTYQCLFDLLRGAR